MTCSECRQPNAPERNWCGACGARLARYCALCGFRNFMAHRFCGGCGAALEEAAERPAEFATGRAQEDRTRAPGPQRQAPAGDLAELLEAAQEAAAPEPAAGEVRVDQNDIDSLFGE